jgi:hypothetical protein
MKRQSGLLPLVGNHTRIHRSGDRSRWSFGMETLTSPRPKQQHHHRLTGKNASMNHHCCGPTKQMVAGTPTRVVGQCLDLPPKLTIRWPPPPSVSSFVAAVKQKGTRSPVRLGNRERRERGTEDEEGVWLAVDLEAGRKLVVHRRRGGGRRPAGAVGSRFSLCVLSKHTNVCVCHV